MFLFISALSAVIPLVLYNQEIQFHFQLIALLFPIVLIIVLVHLHRKYQAADGHTANSVFWCLPLVTQYCLHYIVFSVY